MNKLVYFVLLVILLLPAVGQKTRDRNLIANRKHSDTSTVLPPRTTAQSGQKDVTSQLDKLERQTANTVVQPAAKPPKTPAFKLPSDNQPSAATAYQQTMPAHATKSALSGTTQRRSSRPSTSNRYGR